MRTDRTSPRRVPRLISVLVPAVLLAPFSVASADPTAEVVDRCLYQMGEFGAELVQACVTQDLAAANALSQYPEQAQEIVARCTRQMQRAGWSMVKACADQAIEAEKAKKKD